MYSPYISSTRKKSTCPIKWNQYRSICGFDILIDRDTGQFHEYFMILV